MKALVTGGSKGIGAAIAAELHKQGHHVSTCSRSSGCDVLDPNQIDNYLYRNGSDFDILVNNAGGGGTWGNGILDTGRNVWREVYQKNAGAAMQFTMACLPHMKDKGWGRVVFITSLGNDRPWFNMAKQAETAMMETLSRRPEFVRRGVTFNAVAPGRIAVGKEADVTPEYLESLPMGRLGSPEEVGAVVAFLCSGPASLVNGAVIRCGDV